MAADTMPVLTNVVREQRRSLALWGLALAAVTALYVGLFPSFQSTDLTAFTENLPDAMVEAFGYDTMATAGGWITSTAYGLLGPVLLIVFGVSTGARLVAGGEEDGSLELELTAPVSRLRVLFERLVALWLDLAALVLVVAGVTTGLVLALDMDVDLARLAVATVALWLMVAGFSTVAYAVGASTGRRAYAIAAGAGLAVGAFVLNALSPMLDAGWMAAISPFSWYLEPDPLLEGIPAGDLALLALVPAVAASVAFLRFPRRDLMV